MAIAVIAVARTHQARIAPGFWVVAVPLLLAAGTAAYVLVAGPYLSRRAGGRRGTVLVDCLVGMLTECVVVVLFAALLGAVSAIRTGADQGLASAFGTFVAESSFAALYAAANFMDQILVVGNAAGLIGWWLLRREARTGSGAGPSRPQERSAAA